MEEESILNKVLHQIISDVEHGDLIELDAFLKVLYKEETKRIFIDFFKR